MLNTRTFIDLKAALAGILKHPAVLMGFMTAVAGPFAILVIGGAKPNNLPGYFWVAVAGFVLAVISVSLLMFTRTSARLSEISISPDRR